MNVNISAIKPTYKSKTYHNISKIILVGAHPIEIEGMAGCEIDLPFLSPPATVNLSFDQPPTNVELKPVGDANVFRLIIYGDVDVADIHDFQERYNFKW